MTVVVAAKMIVTRSMISATGTIMKTMPLTFMIVGANVNAPAKVTEPIAWQRMLTTRKWTTSTK